MVHCTPQRKICFFWSLAGVIATETCVFFVLLLIFTVEKYENSAQTAAELETSPHGRYVANPNSLNKSKGYLTFLPSHRKTFTVDFLNSTEYKRNMEMVSEKYSAKNLRNCQHVPHLELHDCDSQSSHGTQEGVFCLVARLEHTGKWIPDKFLPVDWLPNYDPNYLPVSCEVIAQNSSISHRGRSHDFHYKKQVPTIWPASGFLRSHFGKDIPNDCYPPVTIKIDDPFVLSYPHDLVSVSCHVWAYNSKLLHADSVSINVTLRNREDALSNVVRKVLLPVQTTVLPNVTKTIVTTTETATSQVILPSTANRKPVDVFPVPVSESMPCINCTNAPFPMTESSVPTTPNLPASTIAETYTNFVIPSASSHESSTSSIPTEITALESSTEAVSWTDQSTSQTESVTQTTIFSISSDTHEKTDEITKEPSSDQNISVFLKENNQDSMHDETDASGDSSWPASRQTTLNTFNSFSSSPILIDTTLSTPDSYGIDPAVKEGFILNSNGPQPDYTTTLEMFQYSQDQDLTSIVQPAKTDASQTLYSSTSFVPMPSLSSDDTTSTSTRVIPTETTTLEIEDYDTPSFPKVEQTLPDLESSGETSNEAISSNAYDSRVEYPSTTMSTNTEQFTNSIETLETSSLVSQSTSLDYDDYDSQATTEFSTTPVASTLSSLIDFPLKVTTSSREGQEAPLEQPSGSSELQTDHSEPTGATEAPGDSYPDLPEVDERNNIYEDDPILPQGEIDQDY